MAASWPAPPAPRLPSDASDPRPDILIIQSVRAGRTADFEVLYRRYRDWAYRVAWRFTGDPEAATDALRDVFARLRGRWDTLELHARLTTVLYPLIRESCRALRGRGEAVGPRLWPAPPPERPDSLVAAVNGLPEDEREVMLLRIVDGLGVAAVAAALSMPEADIKSRLQRALAALREADPRHAPGG